MVGHLLWVWPWPRRKRRFLKRASARPGRGRCRVQWSKWRPTSISLCWPGRFQHKFCDLFFDCAIANASLNPKASWCPIPRTDIYEAAKEAAAAARAAGRWWQAAADAARAEDAAARAVASLQRQYSRLWSELTAAGGHMIKNNDIRF